MRDGSPRSRPGSSTDARPPPRIPVKLHKQVSLIRTAEPLLAEELLARKIAGAAGRGAALGDGLAGPRRGGGGAPRRAAADGPHPPRRPLRVSATMADAEDRARATPTTVGRAAPAAERPALSRVPGGPASGTSAARLREIAAALGLGRSAGAGRTALAGAIAERLGRARGGRAGDRPASAHGPAAGAGPVRPDRDRRPGRSPGCRTRSACLGVDPRRGDPAAWLDLGLLAASAGADGRPVGDFGAARSPRPSRAAVDLVAHPAAMAAARTVLPEGAAPPIAGAGPAGPRDRRPGADPPAGRRLAAGRRGAAPPDPAGDALQARPRAARGRPGPRRPDRRRARAAARHGGALARPGAGRRPDRAGAGRATGSSPPGPTSGPRTRSTCPR